MVIMKKFFICTVCFFICAMVTAQTHVFFHYSGNIYSERIENIDSISFPNTISFVHNHTGEPEFQFPISGIDSITFSDEAPQADTGNIVYIIYNNDEVTIINPYQYIFIPKALKAVLFMCNIKLRPGNVTVFIKSPFIFYLQLILQYFLF